MANGPVVLSSASPDETRAIGERIGAALAPGSVVLLRGPLGAGKTVLAKGIARGLGIEDEIISPTYTIVADYPGRIPLAHVDLYRVEGATQIANLGLDDLLAGPGVTVVEWGEKLEPTLRGRGAVRVTISLEPDGGRLIVVEGLAS
ncbi:MAG: tRNA (adenosine(37)-N6)-threonylcarbamoyltransferase complex ATPase subunit type 1 TsaE [Spirochaetes bacterium]|nr:tRNA (adenosine(37)-N6)-threonylcarbamoyltransferase complex ATPase subunit type 1 TsaE [Spirochaetota bacterium]